MKVYPFKIPKPHNDAIIYQEDHEMIFYDKYHEHEEIQISFILEGRGTLIVGDTVNDYTNGDVLVIGSNLPHVFKSDVTFGQKSKMLTLFFTRTSFGPHFFEIEELKSASPFFKRSMNGFKTLSNKKKMADLFTSLKVASKIDRFLILMNLIKLLSKAKHERLSTFIYEKQYSDLEGKRMRDIMEYTMNNYQDSISLEDISNVATMTKNAFCKYFKKRTNKTYFKFLNELRIEQACKLLISDRDMTIAEIAAHSGFNNISNFNRIFRRLKKSTPKQFAQLHQ